MRERSDGPSDSHGSVAVDRRDLLTGAIAAAGAAAMASPVGARTERNPSGLGKSRADSDAIRAGTGIATTRTPAGQVAGYIQDDIVTFKGIPYGADTGGANRFRPPAPPKPWTGIRSARAYGPVSPQDKGTGRLNDEEAFVFQWNDSVENEDCLRLNVWTPSVTGGRRPVLVWLHGGGFAAGSGHDLPAFDGLNLAKRGDVVVVTVNHRLNLLGFFDLSSFGPDCAQSGNAGMLDIVAALRWIHDTIDQFGGDPDRVLMFGQSGGGAKVSALMGMPAARGLFHRAVVMSGSFAPCTTPEKSARLTNLTLAELGIARGPDTVERLRALPYAQLLRASDVVLARVNRPSAGFIDARRLGNNLGFAPVVDGTTLMRLAERADMPDISGDVPMMIGSTLNEFVTGINHPEVEAMREADLVAKVETVAPGRSAAVIAAFRHRTPDASPFDLWSRIATAPIRQSAVDQALAKSSGKAPAYLYWFTWQTPILDGRPRAFHCLDIPFMFANSERCATMTGGGPRAAALSGRMADALVAFARTGTPNHPGLPSWPPVTSSTVASMILDDHPRVELDPDRVERATVTRSA